MPPRVESGGAPSPQGREGAETESGKRTRRPGALGGAEGSLKKGRREERMVTHSADEVDSVPGAAGWDSIACDDSLARAEEVSGWGTEALGNAAARGLIVTQSRDTRFHQDRETRDWAGKGRPGRRKRWNRRGGGPCLGGTLGMKNLRGSLQGGGE